MSHDPWVEDSKSLDLTGSAEDRVHVPLHSQGTTRIGSQQMVTPTLPGYGGWCDSLRLMLLQQW